MHAYKAPQADAVDPADWTDVPNKMMVNGHGRTKFPTEKTRDECAKMAWGRYWLDITEFKSLSLSEILRRMNEAIEDEQERKGCKDTHEIGSDSESVSSRHNLNVNIQLVDKDDTDDDDARSVACASSPKKMGKHVVTKNVGKQRDRRTVTRSATNKKPTFVKSKDKGKRRKLQDGHDKKSKEEEEKLLRKKTGTTSTSGRISKSRPLSQVSKGSKHGKGA